MSDGFAWGLRRRCKPVAARVTDGGIDAHGGIPVQETDDQSVLIARVQSAVPFILPAGPRRAGAGRSLELLPMHLAAAAPHVKGVLVANNALTCEASLAARSRLS